MFLTVIFPILYSQEEGVDINTLDGDEATPLHFAASRGHSDTVSREISIKRHMRVTATD